MDIPNTKKAQGIEIVNAFKAINDNWMMHLEIYNHQAKVAKAKYDAAIVQGFTELQALQICHKTWEF
jgi:hypothetical protein